MVDAGAQRLADGLAKALADVGVIAQVPRAASLVGLFFGEEPPLDYAAAKRTDEAAYARFFHALLAEGVAIAPGAYEVLLPGLAHTPAVIDEIVAAAARGAAAAFG